jgi:hypothetical protein
MKPNKLALADEKDDTLPPCRDGEEIILNWA